MIPTILITKCLYLVRGVFSTLFHVILQFLFLFRCLFQLVIRLPQHHLQLLYLWCSNTIISFSIILGSIYFLNTNITYPIACPNQNPSQPSAILHPASQATPIHETSNCAGPSPGNDFNHLFQSGMWLMPSIPIWKWFFSIWQETNIFQYFTVVLCCWDEVL